MAFAQEKLEDSLRRLRIRQDLADARLDGVEAAAEAAAAPPAGSAGAMPESALFQGLGRYAHWKPPAFAVWWVSGGGGRVGVSVPGGCVSYNGNHMDDGVLTPSVQKDPETGFRWCELEAPSEEAPKLVLTLLVELDGVTHEPGDEVTVAYLEWAASVDAAKADHEETDRKVVACVPVAEYDAKLDRLVQVHVGALALGGGGAPGDSAGVKVSTSSYETAGGGNGIGVTFQPTKNGEDEGDSAGLGIEVEESQPTTGDPGGATIKFQRAKNGQAEGDPVSVTISNGSDGSPGADGVGVGSVSLKSTSGKTKTYSVMSDEATPAELGTFEVTDGGDGSPGADGVGVGSVSLKSTSGKTKTYSVMSDEATPAELGTFEVTDGDKGDPGEKGDKGDPGEKGDKGDNDLSDTPALDVVPSTGQASAGVAATASRQDHVHKLPDTVVLTDVAQTINSVKKITPARGTAVARLDFQYDEQEGGLLRVMYTSNNEEQLAQIYLGSGGLSLGNLILALGTSLVLGARATGTVAIDNVQLGAGADAALASITPTTSGTNSRRVVDMKWVTNYFQQKLITGSNITIIGNTISAIQPTVNDGTLTIKQGTTTLGTFTANQANGTTVTIPEPPTPPSGTVDFIPGDGIRWNPSTHTLQKRVDTLNMATGQVTQGQWSDIINGSTTPISSIVTQPSSS